MKRTCKFTLDATLPKYPTFEEGIRRAPDRGYSLTPAQTRVALQNALRYVPKAVSYTHLDARGVYRLGADLPYGNDFVNLSYDAVSSHSHQGRCV